MINTRSRSDPSKNVHRAEGIWALQDLSAEKSPQLIRSYSDAVSAKAGVQDRTQVRCAEPAPEVTLRSLRRLRARCRDVGQSPDIESRQAFPKLLDVRVARRIPEALDCVQRRKLEDDQTPVFKRAFQHVDLRAACNEVSAAELCRERPDSVAIQCADRRSR